MEFITSTYRYFDRWRRCIAATTSSSCDLDPRFRSSLITIAVSRGLQIVRLIFEYQQEELHGGLCMLGSEPPRVIVPFCMGPHGLNGCALLLRQCFDETVVAKNLDMTYCSRCSACCSKQFPMESLFVQRWSLFGNMNRAHTTSPRHRVMGLASGIHFVRDRSSDLSLIHI